MWSTKFWSNMMRKDISANFYVLHNTSSKRFVTMVTYWVPDLSNIKGFSGHLWHSILIFTNKMEEGAVASWLVHLTLEWAVEVRALAADIASCSWAKHFTPTVPLSTQVYKQVWATCWGNLTNLLWTSIPIQGSRSTSSCFTLQKPG